MQISVIAAERHSVEPAGGRLIAIAFLADLSCLHREGGGEVVGGFSCPCCCIFDH